MNQVLFRRKSSEYLSEWCNRGSDRRKPLVLRGARQVGKSTLVNQLARNLGLEFVEINFEKNPRLQKIFDAQDFDTILSGLKILAKKDLESSPILLFLDEIQKSPRAIESLRYFYEDFPNLKVIAAGSLLDFTLNEAKLSMPVGRIQYGFVHPMTYSEFLLGIGEQQLTDEIREYRLPRTINPATHQKLLDYYKIYMFVGGMPEAVKSWAKKGQPHQVSEVHQSLLSTYRDDFGKYTSGKEFGRLQRLFDQFPSHLGRKIKYSKIAPHDQARDIRQIIDILAMARVIHKVHHSNCSDLPLAAQRDDFVFKLYFIDVGLVCSALDLSYETVTSDEKTHLINGVLGEQCIFQNIKASSFEKDLQIYYWLRDGKAQNAELDFVVAHKGRIIPIEVKAGKSGSLRSLHQFIADRKSDLAVRFDTNEPSAQEIKHSVVTREGIKEIQFRLISLPCYLAEELIRIIS